MAQLTTINEIDSTDVATSVKCDIADLQSFIPIKNTNLSIVAQNITSVYGNFDDFQITLSNLNLNVDIIILTECRLNPSKPIPYCANYKSTATSNNMNQNDGVVSYVNDYLDVYVEEVKLEHASCLSIKINDTIILGITDLRLKPMLLYSLSISVHT